MTWNEDDYNKWKNYPIGEYWSSELIQRPHPQNVCSYQTEDGYPVLVVLRLHMLSYPLGTPHEKRRVDKLYEHEGFSVTVWLPRRGIPITSAMGVVKTIEEIDDLVKRLKEEVDIACLHPNSKELRPKYACDHRFECLDCGKVWGYDSSG